MSEPYKHSISKHIRRIYCKKIIFPTIALSILASLWLIFPLYHIIVPQHLDNFDAMETHSDSRSSYIETSLKDLYFTGYTNTFFGQTTGYYYYTPWNHQCVIVLLSPHTCKEGLPYLESVTIRGKILEGNNSYFALLDNLSQDLNWTNEGISQKVNKYFISEPAFMLIANRVLMTAYFFSGVCAIVWLLFDLLCICIPVCCPACRKLKLFGKSSLLFHQAEEELAALAQSATEDMFITEHFFILLADHQISIVPIQEIIWIYKYSNPHKFLWHPMSISYTLHITAKRHFYLQCPKKVKSDIDHIIKNLSEANRKILVGFSEENRQKARNLQHYRLSLQLAKLIVFFQKRR
ncbi:MAG: hypothetical protein HFI74_09015 [Lachnospiraceae bacterium]|jgi:hypothetical protein|nr:hypothetical protein [Lachnospiraceae bacterium]